MVVVKAFPHLQYALNVSLSCSHSCSKAEEAWCCAAREPLALQFALPQVNASLLPVVGTAYLHVTQNVAHEVKSPELRKPLLRCFND